MKTIFVLCGPGGVGKSKIAKEVAKQTNLTFVKAYTTREKRKDDKDYNFVTKKEFLQFVENNEMAEYNLFCNEYYGRKIDDFKTALSKKNSCISIIDPLSIKEIKNIKFFSDKNIVTIFIDANDNNLKDRLQNRGEKSEVIDFKLKNSKIERKNKSFCDFAINNDNFEDCANKIVQIIKSF